MNFYSVNFLLSHVCSVLSSLNLFLFRFDVLFFVVLTSHYINSSVRMIHFFCGHTLLGGPDKHLYQPKMRVEIIINIQFFIECLCFH